MHSIKQQRYTAHMCSILEVRQSVPSWGHSANQTQSCACSFTRLYPLQSSLEQNVMHLFCLGLAIDLTVSETRSQAEKHESVVNMPTGFRLLLSIFRQAALRLNCLPLLLALLPWPIELHPWVLLNVCFPSLAHVWDLPYRTPFHALDFSLLLLNLEFLLLVKHFR